MALFSLHLKFCGPNYVIFAKTVWVGLSLEFLSSLVLDSFVDLTSTSNLIWLKAILGSVFFMKVVLLCLSFSIPQESDHFDLSIGSYGQIYMYCLFGLFLGLGYGHPNSSSF